MKAFLEFVAEDILNKYGNNLSKIAVVFPNKRASLFMNEYLATNCDKPVWCPQYITISDLFRKLGKYVVPDQIKLICDLHKCFVSCTGIDESLDHFYGWGLVMLSDFDDIDKNMADASKVFANVKDIHAYDDTNYLTDAQKEILKKFFANFSDDKNSELKQRFLSIWSRFLDIYIMFNNKLKSKGLAYEGALYREVVCDETVSFEYEKYIFVGFNMTQAVERHLFRRLQKQGQAEFYWDFDNYYLDGKTQTKHEAGHYIYVNLRDFPCSLAIDNNEIYDNLSKNKNITFISATTEDIQARFASDWLKEEKRYEQGRKTAIVLCNEALMQTVLHSLPEDTGPVNITIGYPLQQTPVASFIRALISLRCEGFNHNRNRFALSFVNKVLNQPYIPYITDNYDVLLNELNNSHRVFYPSTEQLSKDEALALIFKKPSEEDNTSHSFELNLLEWLTRIIKTLAQNTKSIDEPLFKEALFKAYTLLVRLTNLIKDGDLNVNYITLQGLINQLIQSTSIPFHGEPAEGLQIMGVLETRNLDFDNLLILSCNEGNMPKGINDSSFIPHSIRKAFGLTTIDNKVAIYAYYFYRLVQRAKNITITYNNATNDGNKSEMSRFLIQMLVESNHHIKQKAFRIGLGPNISSIEAVEKSEAVMEKLIKRFDKSHNNSKHPLLTPTAINLYLRCQLRFYYNYVCNIKEPDLNDEEKIDGRVFGNIFHYASQLVYKKLQDNEGWIRPSHIEKILKSDVELQRAVDKAFCKELFNLPSGLKPEYNGHQLINREVIIIYLRRLLENDIKLGNFKIIGLEKEIMEDLKIDTTNHKLCTTLGGFIDRLDMISTDTDVRIRVIDYKTGKYKLEKFTEISDLFNPENISKHSDYFLQTLLYSKIVSESVELNSNGFKVSPALLFIQQSVSDNNDIILQMNGKTINDINEYKTDFTINLANIVNNIFDNNKPFVPTEYRERCKLCPYAGICNV